MAVGLPAGGAARLLRRRLGHLPRDQHPLDAVEQLLGLGQRQPHILGPQLATLEHGNLLQDFGVMAVAFDNDLNAQLHRRLLTRRTTTGHRQRRTASADG